VYRLPTGLRLVKDFYPIRKRIDTPVGEGWYWSLPDAKEFGCEVDSLPFSIRVLLENALRNHDRVDGAKEAAYKIMDWPNGIGAELPFMPSRVLLQDYTGVPLIVDLAALRDAVRDAGLDPKIVNSEVPVDLIVDHSVQVDRWGTLDALPVNLEMEYKRNSERYSLLKWAQKSFSNMRVFPPGKGICHQVNLEYISTVISVAGKDEVIVFPDTLVGTDSHTTMVNGMAVLGWGVGGIEAEAVMLGEPYHMPVPKVTGVKLTGSLQEGSTPTDIVLTVTEALRRKGVVGQFVEYFGEGYQNLSVPDRATIGNMSPEYGATVGFCPIDENTLDYLRGTGRSEQHVRFVERYARANAMFYDPDQGTPRYTDIIEIDLGRVEPSIAGPRNPDERIPLSKAPAVIARLLDEQNRKKKQVFQQQSGYSGSSVDNGFQPVESGDQQLVSLRSSELQDGSIIIAAITSCTNTSNPTVMLGAALMAQKIVDLGLAPKPFVKTSMAPGSRVVTDYLENSGLLPYLDRLGFNVVGYGCTTCIGNSGPLLPEVEAEIKSRDLYAVAVLSGNRNFDGRIHPLAKGSFLTSPMLVVAYSLVGNIGFDISNGPLGVAKDGKKVFLKDIWPTMDEIRRAVANSLNPELYRKRYSDATVGDERWNALQAPVGDVFDWDPKSTYVKQPPWFKPETIMLPTDIKGARVLAVFEDKVTTDHISPAGSIPYDGPAGRYLRGQGVQLLDFSSFGSRRGNHEVMVRGGFSNIRLKNLLAGGKEGGWTTHFPSGELMTIYDASERYRSEKVPLLVLAGKGYGAGSSRDWAAKAPLLLGVRAVIAESFERIHRSNLVAMGILPLQFEEGQGWKSLGLKGNEVYDITGISGMKSPGERLLVSATKEDGKKVEFPVLARVDNRSELRYLESGGILPYVMNKIMRRQNSES